jgi:hypothetical protein
MEGTGWCKRIAINASPQITFNDVMTTRWQRKILDQIRIGIKQPSPIAIINLQSS